ncbi:MAG TPA: S1/P1 nuclease [Polyangia bacterium]|jgi:hypothetical protein
MGQTARWILAGLVASGVALAAPTTAQAWGPDGHVIVARIAEKHLSAKARTGLADLLDGRDLADIASWADDWRDPHPETAGWHFVDIPLSAAAYDAARDCVKGNCAVEALIAQLAILRDKTMAADARKRALRFVVHLVGDLHQPLHAATDDRAPGGTDRGGNLVKARLGIADPEFPYHSSPNGNLHSVWDADLIDAVHRQQEAYAAALAKLPDTLVHMQAGTPADWANEAHQLARDVTYKSLPAPDAAGVRQLTAAYAAQSRPIVERQLQRAGVRLARLLNESF